MGYGDGDVISGLQDDVKRLTDERDTLVTQCRHWKGESERVTTERDALAGRMDETTSALQAQIAQMVAVQDAVIRGGVNDMLEQVRLRIGQLLVDINELKKPVLLEEIPADVPSPEAQEAERQDVPPETPGKA